MDEDLYGVFCSFAAFGAGKGAVAELDNAKFAKLCRDSGVLDKAVASTTVDLAFTKVKDKAARKINFDQFLQALQILAKAKYPSSGADAFEKLRSVILSSTGPAVASNVEVDATGIFAKLTDHTKYTGAHKERFDESGEGKGLAGRDSTATGTGSGADAFHGGAVSDLSAITREGTRGGTSLSSATRAREAVPAIERIPATVHAAPAKAPVSARSPAATSERAPVSSRSPAASSDRAPGSARSPAATSARAPEERRASAGGGEAPSDLYAIFTSYCAFGGTSSGYVPELDNAKFAKLCRESGVIDKRVTPASVDITFSKVKSKTKRVIGYDEFLAALRSLAHEKYPADEPHAAADKLVEHIVSAGGPALVGTSKVDAGGVYSKLTDHTLYTGAHQHRFDEDGVGKGLGGRDSTATGGGPGKYHGGTVADLSQITRSNLH